MSKSGELRYATARLVHDRCLCLHAQRAARALARRFDDALRPLGLTNGQFSLLMSLNRREPARISAIASLLAMDRTTLTAAVKPLEGRALIQVTADEADRRGRQLVLTAKGRKLLARAVPVWKRTHRKIEQRLPHGEAERVREALRVLV